MEQTLRTFATRLRLLVSHFIQHVREDWPATVFVAAALALLDHHVGWLDAINAHSFVLIGNAAELPKPAGQTNAKALVVLIDQFAAQSRYFERSPLYRCRLERDLIEVYAAMRRFNDRSTADKSAKKLDLLVIDLDLSPARWLAIELGSETPEAGCESRLHQLIVDEAKEKSYPIRTVLMNPFDQVTADSYTKETHAEWRTLNATPNVTFGSATLPLEYGLVIKQYCDADTLAAMAFLRTADPRRKENCVDKAIERKPEPRTKKELIDPRKYLAGVVPIATAVTGNQESELLSSRLDQKLTDKNFVAVFFGAAFGDEDNFVTPLADLYGVEIHAASYLSLLDPLRTDHRLTELLVDIAFGFVFGGFIAWCWKRYFELRLSNDAAQKLYAPFYVLLLAVGVCVIAVALTFVSWIFLVRCGIWASPIPMAVGMLLESFVSGSVAQGIEVAKAAAPKSETPQSEQDYFKKFYGGDETARLLGTRWVIWILVVVIAFLTAVYG